MQRGRGAQCQNRSLHITGDAARYRYTAPKLLLAYHQSHLGALLGVIIEGVPNLPVLGPLYSLLHKLIVDGLMDKGPGSSCAALTLHGLRQHRVYKHFWS